MASTKNPSIRPVPSIARAAQKTRSVIEDLQTRLTEVSQHGGVARPGSTASEAAVGREGAEPAESEAELEQQLAAYFAHASVTAGTMTAADGRNVLEELRRRVVDGVVERILEAWTSGRPAEPGGLRNEVLERLIERVLQQFGRSSSSQIEARPS